MSTTRPDRSRRKFFKLLPLAMLAGCNASPSGGLGSVARSFQSVNDWLQGKVFDPAKLAPEYSDAEVTPVAGFRTNSYDTDAPDMDVAEWTLTVDGLVSKPGEYALAQIQAFPKRTQNTRHVCVEGWSMIPQWGGTPMAALLDFVGADPAAKFLSVECGDDYYTSYDMGSARHPQTILAYEAYGKALDLGHGAPLRIVMPVKLGYKSAKWLTRIEVTNEKKGGYWEDDGYDWFAGT